MGRNEAGDQLGWSLAAGDFDGNGTDDLAAGAPGEAPRSDPRSGFVFTFAGAPDGLVAWKGLDQSVVPMPPLETSAQSTVAPAEKKEFQVRLYRNVTSEEVLTCAPRCGETGSDASSPLDDVRKSPVRWDI